MPEGPAPVFASSAVRSGWGAANPYAEITHRVAFRAFLATTVVACGLALAGVRASSPWSWFFGFHLVIAVLTTLAALARRLPLQNVVACGLALVLTMGMALVVAGSGLRGQPELASGVTETRTSLGIHDLGWLAWPAPFLWTAVLLASRQTAKVLLQPWRRQKVYGWWLLGAATGLAWLAVVVSGPLVSPILGWWSWPKAGSSWHGVPPWWLAGVPALIALFLLLAGAWLIPKRPTGRASDFEPVWGWGGLVLWLALGNLRSGFWTVALLGVVGVAVVTPLAWRTIQMPISPAAGPGGSA